ncbi:GspE/PulE family protein [Patescibacteria group bacterium]|nr:GspE/PulE family protein [Patescibacteria group bacterium]MBU1754662.1 GspE/PulE family protein [Patescibacteria group bacterium]
MPTHFDTDAEDSKLARLREREEEDLTQILAEKYRFPYTDLTAIPINMDALRVVPEKEAIEAEAVAFDKNGRHLSVAIHNPNNSHLPALEHALQARGFTVERYMISKRSLAVGLGRYKELSLATVTTAGVFDLQGDEFRSMSEDLSSVPALKEFLDKSLVAKKNAQLSQIFEGLLASAFGLKASDIHIEPEETGVRLRFRLDGVLTDIYTFDDHAYRLLNSRIKLLSGLKLNVGNRAQDGRFSVVVNEKEVEIRTSIIPGNYGESAVLRILDPSAISHSFSEMGVHPKLLERLQKEIRRPNGMLLTTGPTGSGKTTTLYAFLKEVQTPEIKVVTIEDPIEYHLQGIVQTQTNGKDYTFASGLRSVLRQDPDVIMVGEIRDADVAATAIQAALTGHFVLSTLHTNNAAGAFPRLVDLGIDPKTIPSAVTVAMAQRLVRTLNKETRVKRPATPEEVSLMKKEFETCTDPALIPTSFDELWSPTESEGGSGYKGRTAVVEAIFMDDELAEFLRTNPSSSDIQKNTRRQGYLTMAQDGILKALEGITTIEEVVKVVDLGHS